MASPTNCELLASTGSSIYSKKLGCHLCFLVNIRVATAMASGGLVCPWRRCVGPREECQGQTPGGQAVMTSKQGRRHGTEPRGGLEQGAWAVPCRS